MKLKKPLLITLSAIMVMLCIFMGLIGVKTWQALQSTPTLQFTQAHHRWEASLISHYRLVASYYGNFAQCYYDIEVQNDHFAHVYTMSCISSAESKTLTVSGIFKNFERYAAQRVCSPNGCSCEGMYVLQATYNPTLGYPENITTIFNRDSLYDLLHGTFGIQRCLRTDPIVEKFDRVKVSPLP